MALIMSNFSKETVYQIWNDRNGYRVEVGPDSDSLDLIEIRKRDDKNNIYERMVFEKEEALILLECLAEALKDCKG
jgi:hypothetical protein